MMLDLLAFCQEHGVFTDVRRQVGHALEVPADEQQLEGGCDRPGVGPSCA
jgi:hypothetical protein